MIKVLTTKSKSAGFGCELRNKMVVCTVQSVEKQTKNRNETGSNLSLGTRLTRVKRLSRKRCCDTTPDRCQEGSRLTILFRIS